MIRTKAACHCATLKECWKAKRKKYVMLIIFGIHSWWRGVIERAWQPGSLREWSFCWGSMVGNSTTQRGILRARRDLAEHSMMWTGRRGAAHYWVLSGVWWGGAIVLAWGQSPIWISFWEVWIARKWCHRESGAVDKIWFVYLYFQMKNVENLDES